jgi:hypothetical protein
MSHIFCRNIYLKIGNVVIEIIFKPIVLIRSTQLCLYIVSLHTSLWRATQSNAWHCSLQNHETPHLEHLNGALVAVSVTKQLRLLQAEYPTLRGPIVIVEKTYHAGAGAGTRLCNSDRRMLQRSLTDPAPLQPINCWSILARMYRKMRRR